MNLIQAIESEDKSTIIFSGSVLAGVLFGIWRKKGLLIVSLYGAGFGVAALVVNNVFKIK